MPRIETLAANQIQNSSIGLPWRSASGIALIPLVSMLQTRSLSGCSRSHPTISVPICCSSRHDSAIELLAAHYGDAAGPPARAGSRRQGRTGSLGTLVLPMMLRGSCREGPRPVGGTMALAGERAGERGSVAVLMALALTVLLGFAALVVDVGLSWAVRAEAQTAADAAALAGAGRLADATAGGLPGAPGLACGLCLLDPLHGGVLAVAGSGDMVVEGGGVTVDSSHPDAAILSDSGDVIADRIDLVGGVVLTGSGRFLPPPTTGAPPAPDPLAALPTPDTLPAPPPCCFGRVTVIADRTLAPGVYESITVTDHATLTLDPGVYVLTELPGLAVLENASVQGTAVTLYLTCNDYPTPCTTFGAAFTLTASARYTATAPTTGPYANLTLFSDRANPTPLLLATTADTATATLYASNARLLLAATGDLRTTHPLILARPTTP